MYSHFCCMERQELFHPSAHFHGLKFLWSASGRAGAGADHPGHLQALHPSLSREMDWSSWINPWDLVLGVFWWAQTSPW